MLEEIGEKTAEEMEAINKVSYLLCLIVSFINIVILTHNYYN